MGLHCPVLRFVYILIHGKEEWVLTWLGSQHNCVVRPVFIDYLITRIFSGTSFSANKI